MDSRQTLTFTNKSGICASKKRVIFAFLLVSLFISILGISAYQLFFGDRSAPWNPPEAVTSTEYRLPLDLTPVYYNLTLRPHLDPTTQFRIDGHVQIYFQCQIPTSNVILHKKNISVSFPSLYEVSSGFDLLTQVKLDGHEFDPTNDFYTVRVKGELESGKMYRLGLEFRSTLNDQLVGFYRSAYRSGKGRNVTKWMGVSQFSPTDARRAFPCWDEPGFKAVFEVTLGRERDMRTFSNMEINSTLDMEGHPGWEWDRYNVSPRMSTYVVGFSVNDFEPSSNDSWFKVWSRREVKGQTAYAASIGPKILDFFGSYFNIPFPLAKMDMLAVPEHRFNAMENWGMITFRELAVLFDPDYSSDANKIRIALIVAHELGHQWFGNLVTPRWWSDLWLKEGFATYLEYLGVNAVEPTWKMLDLFVLNELQTVFKLDALNNSHEISIPVGNPDEINRIFDDISYAKGCSIIRMMDHFLGASTFKQGITNYLQKWKYNNTEQTDLWGALTAQAHLDGTLPETLTVDQIMGTWTLQKGFPLLTVTRDVDDHPDNNQTVVTRFAQNKFSLVPTTTQAGEDDLTLLPSWHIPISMTTASESNFTDTSPKFWLLEKESLQNLTLDPTDWLIVNVQTTGYYRVNYDPPNWNLLTDQLSTNHSLIHVVNRAQLLDDALTLARAGVVTYDLALNLTLYLTHEPGYVPWASYWNQVRFLVDLFLDSEDLDLLKTYIISLIKLEYDRVGFDEPANETVLERSHRTNLLQWACLLDHSDCVDKARALYDTWVTTGGSGIENRIPVNFRALAYCTAVRHGNTTDWEFLKETYTEVDSASEKDRILSALACSKNQTLLQLYLEEAVTPNSFVRKQDSRNVLQLIASSTYIGNRLVFNTLQKDWARIRAYFGDGLSISRLINQGVATKLKTEADVVDMTTFRNDYAGQFGSGQRSVDEAVEIVRTNRHWMVTHYGEVIDWLQNHQGQP